MAEVTGMTPSKIQELLSIKADKTYVDNKIGESTDVVGLISNTHANKLVRLNGSGKLTIYTTSIVSSNDPTNKSYVDGRIQLVSSLPDNPDSSVLYLIEE